MQEVSAEAVAAPEKLIRFVLVLGFSSKSCDRPPSASFEIAFFCDVTRVIVSREAVFHMHAICVDRLCSVF